MQGHQRKLPSGAPEWAALPKPLLAIIMRVAVNSSSARAESYRALQLVCKSWREAFLDYSADLETVAVRLFYATELYDVCKLLPGIIHLEATRMIGPQSIYLHPLSACSRLTSLKFTMEESGNGTPFFDMLALPSRLKNLEIENVMVDADCCRYLRCTDLTSLTFLPYENLEISNPFTLLQHLPKLETELLYQVLHVGQAYNFDGSLAHNRLEKVFGISTLSSLTSLTIQKGWLPGPIQQPVGAPALQRLTLCSVVTTREILRVLCFRLPSLVRLEVDACVADHTTVPQLSTNATLRSLVVSDMLSVPLPLAGVEILSLSCRPPLFSDRELNIPAIASSTALTRLELIYYNRKSNLAPLWELGLKELVLLDCPRIYKALLVPGAFTALQKLHIAEQGPSISPAAFQASLRDPASEAYLSSHKLRRLGTFVLSLPSLIQLSGKCSLFEAAMAEELKGWHKKRVQSRLHVGV